MLESCRNSLERLSLDYVGGSYDYPVELNFHFPNLTHLGLLSADVYFIKDSLNITNLPKLTRLSIETNSTEFHDDVDIDSVRDISALLEGYHSRHGGITSLDIRCAHHPQFNNVDEQAPRALVYLFPAVKELKLNLRVEFQSDYDQYFLSLVETMRSFNDWELTCGQVQFDIATSYRTPLTTYDHEFGSLLVIAVLGGVTGWTGLSNTSIQFTGYRRDRHHQADFRLLDEMRAALLSCRAVQKLTIAGFQIDQETKDNFQTFIRENKLPISVRD
ncbi:uncharacterized protein LOC118437372 [Folsomia candida]|uniref:uncharacterized protein LOC118437372 n=1 Tax=Folsomia candida TaxID=158441 RepID=UPI001604F67E|nr:uncharacterized protein LOC118437372 [Folsomia candida]